LSFADETDDERRRKAAPSTDSNDAQPPAQKQKKKGKPEVGHALRAAYQQTVSEDIPPEMLDLLGKLG
jgi:hypothetical protein